MKIFLLLIAPGALALGAFFLIPRGRRTGAGYAVAVLGCVGLLAAIGFILAVNVGWVSP